jgi:ornithine cyclodeaminase
MIRLDEAEVQRRLPSIDKVALMRETFGAAATGDAGGAVRAAFTTPQSTWFGAMPAWTGGAQPALGAKLVVAIPGNAARGLPTHRAVVVLFDPVTGEPSAWIEAEAITRARTAAVSMLATQALAPTPVGPHAILGAGAQGRAHLEAFAHGGMITWVSIWSRDRTHAEALAAYAIDLGIGVHVADSADDAVAAAIVVTTCTASAEPLFDAASLVDGAHVNAVGACVATKRELPAALIGAGSVVVEDLAAARAEAGDIVLAVHDGAASWDDVTELGPVLEGHVEPRDARVSVFVSVGLGIEDVALAAALARL